MEMLSVCVFFNFVVELKSCEFKQKLPHLSDSGGSFNLIGAK